MGGLVVLYWDCVGRGCSCSFVLCRLWVDLFNVRSGGGGEASGEAGPQWYKISDDVVPVNVTCVHEEPNTIYHITAYNSQVEKICDAKISQPGKNSRSYRFAENKTRTAKI